MTRQTASLENGNVIDFEMATLLLCGAEPKKAKGIIEFVGSDFLLPITNSQLTQINDDAFKRMPYKRIIWPIFEKGLKVDEKGFDNKSIQKLNNFYDTGSYQSLINILYKDTELDKRNIALKNVRILQDAGLDTHDIEKMFKQAEEFLRKNEEEVLTR